MKLKDLYGVVADEICIYECVSIENMIYEDVYVGRIADAPAELLEREVRVIGAKRKNLLDIEVI